MGKISILPPHEAQKIAAGEVVERPASVVKELVENALDAGATQILLFVEDGGKKSLRMVDNGCGMSPEDACLSLQNHATSKLKTVDELTSIATYGFRGEALATIASVSRLTLRTREKTAAQGIELLVENGTIVAQQPTACNVGTEIIVEDLFYNVPARQKFLKKRETEWRAIEQLMIAMAGIHYRCAFMVTHGGNTIFNAPTVTSLRERMVQLWGTAFDEYLIACSGVEEGRGYAVEGVITRPQKTRYDRSSLFMVVNNRWVKNAKLTHALLGGYEHILPPEQYPLGMLSISVTPSDVDINIHPRKEEVRFAHPRLVEQMITAAVKKSLEGVLATQLHRPVEARDQRPFSFVPASYAYEHQVLMADPFEDAPAQAARPSPFSPAPMMMSEPVQPMSVAPQPDMPEPVVLLPTYRYLGQLLATYLLLETDEGLLLVDQHAAHERILYELFQAKVTESSIVQLVFPHMITLASFEMEALLPHLRLFEERGILVEHFGENQIAVRAAPVYAKNCRFEDVLHEVAASIIASEGEDPLALQKHVSDKMCAMMACKSAVKAGDRLSETEVHELLTKLLTVNSKTTCPHGRPTTWFLSKNEIERLFQRDR